MATTKPCGDCGEEKPLDAFSPNPKGRYGRRSYCKACSVKKTKRWLKANRDRANVSRRARWAERADELNRRRREKRGEHERALQRARYQRKRETILAQNRAYDRRNPEKVRARNRRWYEENKEWYVKWREKHEAENLAPACGLCNRSKQDKLVEEWMGVV